MGLIKQTLKNSYIFYSVVICTGFEAVPKFRLAFVVSISVFEKLRVTRRIERVCV